MTPLKRLKTLTKRLTAFIQWLDQQANINLQSDLVACIIQYLINTKDINKKLTFEWFNGFYSKLSEEKILSKR